MSLPFAIPWRISGFLSPSGISGRPPAILSGDVHAAIADAPITSAGLATMIGARGVASARDKERVLQPRTRLFP